MNDKSESLSQMQDSELLDHLGRVLAELHSRQICRTDSFVAEIGEWWAKKLLGVELTPPTTPGVDAIKNDVKCQVKTRRIYEGARSQSSTRRVPDLHIGDYDRLLLVILDEFFQCSEIFEIPRTSLGGLTESTVTKLKGNPACRRLWPAKHSLDTICSNP